MLTHVNEIPKAKGTNVDYIIMKHKSIPTALTHCQGEYDVHRESEIVLLYLYFYLYRCAGFNH